MKNFKKILNGCGIAKGDPYGKIEGVILCGRDEERCHECKAKAVGYVLKTKDMLEFLEWLHPEVEKLEIDGDHSTSAEIGIKLTECKEIIKLAEENGIN